MSAPTQDGVTGTEFTLPLETTTATKSKQTNKKKPGKIYEMTVSRHWVSGNEQ